MVRRTQLVFATLFCVCFTLLARASETVQVRGGEHAEGFARIAVQWASPVAFEAKLDGDTLTIHFARAFTAQLTPLAGQLQHYVASVGQSADGTSIVVRLKQPVEIRTATVSGTIASIDLVGHAAPANKAAAKPSIAKLPEPKTEAQKIGPPGIDPGEALANIAAPAVGAPVNLLHSSQAAGTVDDTPSIALSPSPAATPPAARVAAASPAVEKVEVRGAEHGEAYARIAVEWPSPVGFDAKLEGDTLTIHFARAFAAQLAPLTDQLQHYLASAEQSPDRTSIIVKLKRQVAIKTNTVNGTIASIDLVPNAAAPADESTAKASVAKPPVAKSEAAKTEAKKPDVKEAEAKKTAKAVPKKAGAQKADAQAAPPGVVPPALTAPANPSTPKASPAKLVAGADNAGPSGGVIPLTPVLSLDNGSASLRFDWPMPTAAAVYRRGSAIWIVFAAPSILDLSGMHLRGQSVLEAVDQIRAEGATALRLVVADGFNPSVRRADNAWIIDLKGQGSLPDAPIVVDPRPSPTSASVELHVRDAAPPLHLRDPLLGDKLILVPVADIGRGIDSTQDFVDFRLLPSIQGIVIRPNSDDLVVETDTDAVHITRPRGLLLSSEQDRLLGRAVANGHRMFDFATWRGPANQTFADQRSRLERAIAIAAPSARTRPRLDLARFYFANLFGAESLSVLAQITRDDPAAAADPAFHAMRGAACLLADIDDCATEELGQKNLDNEPEAGLWRGSLAAQTGDWPTAKREFLRGLGLLPSYPMALRNRFALQAAETMLESDLGSSAVPLIDLVLNSSPDPGEQAMAIYLQGRIQQQLGELDKALTLWEQAAASNDRKARARTLYAKAMALYEAKRASRPETIKTLDALRFAWRGDNFEFTLLRRLGELKLAENDLEGGLDTLHLAASYFPDYPAAKDVSKEATDAFADLFIGKTADDVPPVKALAVYDAFHDLVPTGEVHDAIVKKLVDRLVGVDLLDRAAGLLDDQVKNHLTGLDRARAATQEALLRLMNSQPDAAVAALDLDVGAGLPPDLARQRQELRARALLDLNRAPEALAMLGNDNSRDAYRLRADIYWRQHDWKNAAKTFNQLVGETPPQGALDAETTRIVMSWAAALTLDGDQQGIAKLRQEFGAAMAQTASADAFNIVTGDASAAAAGGGTPNDVAARVAQIDTLQNFIAAYKKRLANDKLSAIN